MKVLAVCSYPVEAAATRFRLWQFTKSLAARGIEMEISPFLGSGEFKELYSRGRMMSKLVTGLRQLGRRIQPIFQNKKYDVLFVQREAMPAGPAIFEYLYSNLRGVPIVLDLDDATYVKYVSPTYGQLGSALKFFGKTDRLIDRSEVVTCGNPFIADHVKGRGKRAVVIPTVVDTAIFKPVKKANDAPVIGWIGTHSTFPFLEKLFPVISELARKHRFVLKVVGSGREKVEVESTKVVNLPWSLDRETEDFQNLDIGLYPIDIAGFLDPAWLAGKSGFKAIQYLAVGVPFVMTPVGVCAEIGYPGTTHFNASSNEDWYNAIDKLLSDEGLRTEMGRAGREHSLSHYRLEKHAESLANVLREVCDARTRSRDA